MVNTVKILSRATLCFGLILFSYGCDPDGTCNALEEDALGACCATGDAQPNLPQNNLPPNGEHVALSECVQALMQGDGAQEYDDINGNGEADPGEEVDAPVLGQIICIRAANVNANADENGESTSEEDVDDIGEAQQADASCQAVLTDLQANSCELPTCGEGDLIEESYTIYPSCELIESLEDFCFGDGNTLPPIDEVIETYEKYGHDDGSSPWAPWRVNTTDPSAQNVPPAGWTSLPGDHDPQNASDPAPGLLRTEDYPEPLHNTRTEGIEALRIEVPGNFMRYHVGRTVAVKALEQMADATNTAMNQAPGLVQPFDCDTSTLACKMNILKLVPMDEVIAGVSSNATLAYEVTNDGLKVKDIGLVNDYVSAEWKGGHIELKATKTGSIDLGAAKMPFYPLHPPSNDHGYQPSFADPFDKEGQHLERFKAIFRVPVATCQALETIGGLDPNLRQIYRPHQVPYRCVCGDNEAQSYCLFDDHQRPNVGPLQAVLNNGQLRRATFFCAIDDLPQTLHKDRVATAFVNLGNIPVNPDDFIEHGKEFGCLGMVLQRRTYVANPAAESSSGTGIGFGTDVEFGDYEFSMVHTAASRIDVELSMVVGWEKWLKKRSWLSWLSWILKLIRKIVEWVLDVILSVTILDVLAPSAVTITTNPVELEAHALLYNEAIERHGAMPQQNKIQVGIRRLVTSEPNFVKDGELGLKFSVPSCGDLTSSSGPLDFIQNLVSCSIEVVRATIRFLANAIVKLAVDISDYFFDWIKAIVDKINAPMITQVESIEDEHNLAGVFHDMTYHYVFEPITYSGNIDLGLTNQQRQMLHPFNTLCGLSTEPNLACFLVDFALGEQSGYEANATITIDRLGAKTHYRTRHWLRNKMLAQGVNPSSAPFGPGTDGTSLPPIRYCVPGDNMYGSLVANGYPYNVDAPISAAKNFSSGELGALVDLLDIEVDPTQVTPPALSGKPLDWRSQCSFFMDVCLRPRAELGTTAIMTLTPSARTQLLINEVFFCEDNDHCDPAHPICHSVVDADNAVCQGQAFDDRGDIQDRAKLAVCSLIADVWYKSFDAWPTADCEETKKLNNLMGDINANLPGVMALLQGAGYTPPNQANTIIESLGDCEKWLKAMNLINDGDLETREFTNPDCFDGCVQPSSF